MLENPKGSPLVFFGTVSFFSENKIFPLQFLWYFTTDWVFKIPKGPPFQFFGIVRFFSKICFFSEGSPFNCDKNVDNFGSVPLQLRQKCWQFRKCPPFSAPGARASGPRRATRSIFLVCSFFEKILIFEYCKREYLTLGSLFAFFELWIWRRLGPVPACFSILCEVFWDRRLFSTMRLFNRSFSSEKCPTTTVASSFFFHQTKELTLYVPPLAHSIFTKST